MWRACLNLDNVSCLKMSFPKREFRFIPLEEEKKKSNLLQKPKEIRYPMLITIRIR